MRRTWLSLAFGSDLCQHVSEAFGLLRARHPVFSVDDEERHPVDAVLLSERDIGLDGWQEAVRRQRIAHFGTIETKLDSKRKRIFYLFALKGPVPASNFPKLFDHPSTD